jgi:hypothetical protein
VSIERFDIDVLDLSAYMAGDFDNPYIKEMKLVEIELSNTENGNTMLVKFSDFKTYGEGIKFFNQEILGFTISGSEICFNIWRKSWLKLDEYLEFVDKDLAPTDCFPNNYFGAIHVVTDRIPACMIDADNHENRFLFSNEVDDDYNTTLFGTMLDNKFSTIEAYIIEILCYSNVVDNVEVLKRMANYSEYTYATSNGDIISVDEIDSVKCNYVNVFVGNYLIVSLDKNAFYQNVSQPLYISENGELYFGYTDGNYESQGYVGMLHYRIKDMQAFKRFITKMQMLVKDDNPAASKTEKVEENKLIAAAFRNLFSER